MVKQAVHHIERRLTSDDYTYQCSGLWQALDGNGMFPGAVTTDPKLGAQEYNEYLDARDLAQERLARSQEVQELYAWLSEYQAIAPLFVGRVAKHLLNIYKEPNVMHDTRGSLVESTLLNALPEHLKNVAFNQAIFAASLLHFPHDTLNSDALDSLVLWANPRPTLV